MINILILEDNPTDIELLKYHLKKADIEFKEICAASREEYLAALSTNPDIILADYTLPQFNALEALEILKEKNLDIPFIIVTGTISEIIAVECMKMGAADYLLKDRLTRLGLAVEHALQEHSLGKAKQKAEGELREREALYRALVEMLPVGVLLYKGSKVIYVNPAGVEQLAALSEEELLGRSPQDFVHENDLTELESRINRLAENEEIGSTEMLINRLDGETIVVDVVSSPIKLEEDWHTLTVSMEITEKKQREKELLTLVNLANDIRIAPTDLNIVARINDNLHQSINTDCCGMIFYNSLKHTFWMARLDGVWKNIPEEKFLAWTKNTNERVLESGLPHLGDFSKSNSHPLLKAFSPEIHFFICIPLIAQENKVGTFWLGKSSRFLDREIQLIIAIADMGANALHRVQAQEKLEENFLETVLALAKTIELRDTQTGDHINRVSEWAMETIRELGGTEEQIKDIRWGGLLHDIGKIAVPDHILLKPGKLSSGEWEIMKTHSEVGAQIVAPVSRLANVAPIILSHQEMWDGKGYPNNLSGESIPLGARVIAVVDAYAAMIENRVYRVGIGHEAAVEELIRCKGTQFDPDVVDAFLKIISRD